MIYSGKDKSLNIDEFELIKYKGKTFYYLGIIYTLGKKAGKESMFHIAEQLELNKKIPFSDIYGAYVVVIEEKNEKYTFFTDNSNMRCLFISEESISNSFLDIVENQERNELDINAVCEFLVLGNNYFGKTLINDIRLSDSNQYYVVEENKITSYDKKIGGIDTKSKIEDFSKFLEQMAYSISDYNTTLSLTGGYDSRMIFAALNNKINLNVFISGDNEKDNDIIVADKVAKAAGNKLERIYSKEPILNEEYIENMFNDADGINPFLNEHFFRVNSFIKDISEKRYSLYLTGDGGVLHKDWWWMQDLPFYKIKRCNLRRFYKQRIGYGKTDDIFGSKIKNIYHGLEENFINQLKTYVKEYNTQSYDSFYFNINGSKLSTIYTSRSKNIINYAPLWELELVKYSYDLPRRKRFFYNLMRDVTTKNSKEVAKIPTNYGTTASSEIVYIFRDIGYQGIEYFKKFIRLIGRKVFDQTLFATDSITWNCEKQVRELEITDKAFRFAKEQNIICDSIKIEDISYKLLGRLIQIYMLNEYIN